MGQVDYDALAAQHGGTATVDYDALAAQHGGSAVQAQQQTQEQPGMLDKKIPLTSYGNATLSGLQSVGRGVRDAASGMVNMFAHPIETAKGIANLPSQAAQVPEAVRDINQSADPVGTYAKVGQETAGQGAGQALTALATEGVGRGLQKVAAKAPGNAAARYLYQSALKPSTTLSTKQVRTIVQTGLDEGIPVSAEGVKKISDLTTDLSNKVKSQIQNGAQQGATIDPQSVAQRADQLKARFSNQVSPTDDLRSIEDVKQDFLTNNPKPIAVDQAQNLKSGTYQQLNSKAYGELKGATVEAQKSLARGIKEELETQFPEIKGLNARESKLFGLDESLQRAVRRIDNHQLFGLGTPAAAAAGGIVTGSPAGAIAAATIKTILDNPEFKSKFAIALNHASRGRVPIAAAFTRVANYSNALGNAGRDGSQSQPEP